MLLLPDDFHEHACITLVLHIYSIRISGLILKLSSVLASFFLQRSVLTSYYDRACIGVFGDQNRLFFVFGFRPIDL